MMELYFNHSFLIGTAGNAHGIQQQLKEIASLSACAREEGASVRFYEQLWQTRLGNGQELRPFLYGMPHSEDLRLVLAYVDQGPHYRDQPLVGNLTIQPNVAAGAFAEKLLHLCFADKQEGVVSPAAEQALSSAGYSLSAGTAAMEVWNAIGGAALLAKLRSLHPFSGIQDVFDDIEGRGLRQLVMMDCAKRSARRHNFLGRFPHVHAALLALESVELPNVVDSIDETVRIERFREATGLEISKESPETMKDPYYRNEREFTIPGRTNKELFEWHVKIGNHIRIHYFVDKPSRILYVGHCGRHLPVKNFDS